MIETKGKTMNQISCSFQAHSDFKKSMTSSTIKGIENKSLLK